MKSFELKEDRKLSTGIGCIDNFLEGGIDSGVITEIFGEGGSGKTNMALQLTVSTLSRGEKVIYIDTEGFSSNRFLQMCGGNRDFSRDLILFRPENLGEQEVCLIKSERLLQSSKDIKLLVIDSMTALLRIERDETLKTQGISRDISILNSICNKYGIPVFITNQIYLDIDSDEITPYGGYLLNHFSKTILSIRRLRARARELKIVKHRSIQDGKVLEIFINSTGISCSDSE
ncbi:MAG: DNA repair and recombination protein RadB [Cuniculiplasma sp.]